MVQLDSIPTKRSLPKRPQPAKDLFGPTSLDNDEGGSTSSTRKKMVTVSLEEVLTKKTGTERISLRTVSEAVAKSRRAVVISGAGISCSSGIPVRKTLTSLLQLGTDGAGFPVE